MTGAGRQVAVLTVALAALVCLSACSRSATATGTARPAGEAPTPPAVASAPECPKPAVPPVAMQEPRDALRSAIEACRSGRGVACSQAWAAMEKSSPEEGAWDFSLAFELARRGCALGDAASCGHAASVAFVMNRQDAPAGYLPSPEERGRMSAEYARRACQGGDARACQLAEGGARSMSPALGRQVGTRCRAGDRDACDLMVEASVIDGPEYKHWAKLRHRAEKTACQCGDAKGCWRVAQTLAFTRARSAYGIEPDLVASDKARLRACELGRVKDCFVLGDDFIEATEPGRRSKERAKRVFLGKAVAQLEQRCEGGDVTSCFKAADTLRDGKRAQRRGIVDAERSKSFAEKGRKWVAAACSEANSVSCTIAVRRLAARYDVSAQTFELVGNLCRRGNAAACFLRLDMPKPTGQPTSKDEIRDAEAVLDRRCRKDKDQCSDLLDDIIRRTERRLSDEAVREAAGRMCADGEPRYCWLAGNRSRDQRYMEEFHKRAKRLRAKHCADIATACGGKQCDPWCELWQEQAR